MIPIALGPAVIGAAVAALVASVGGIGWATARKRRVIRIETAEEAAEAAQAQLPGFAVSGAVVGADGRGARRRVWIGYSLLQVRPPILVELDREVLEAHERSLYNRNARAARPRC